MYTIASQQRSCYYYQSRPKSTLLYYQISIGTPLSKLIQYYSQIYVQLIQSTIGRDSSRTRLRQYEIRQLELQPQRDINHARLKLLTRRELFSNSNQLDFPLQASQSRLTRKYINLNYTLYTVEKQQLAWQVHRLYYSRRQ